MVETRGLTLDGRLFSLFSFDFVSFYLTYAQLYGFVSATTNWSYQDIIYYTNAQSLCLTVSPTLVISDDAGSARSLVGCRLTSLFSSWGVQVLRSRMGSGYYQVQVRVQVESRHCSLHPVRTPVLHQRHSYSPLIYALPIGTECSVWA